MGIERTRVFEVDRPTTQEAKLERLKRVIDPLPAPVTFVQVDFNSQQIYKRLQRTGCNEQGTTLFIRQGVGPIFDTGRH